MAIEEGRMRGLDAESAAMAFLGALHFRTLAQGMAPEAISERDDRQWAESVVDLLLEGLLSREET